MSEALAGGDPQGFLALWKQLERNRARVDAAVEHAARRIPAFAAILDQIPPEVRAADSERSRALQRAAFVEGRWDVYVEDLRAQGKRYAEMGIAFGEWFELLEAFRRALFEELFPEGQERVQNTLLAMDRFLDIAMSNMGTAYIERKEGLVRKAESKLELFSDMFRNASVGMLVYRWDAPPDPDSLRLVATNPAASRLARADMQAFVGRTLAEMQLPQRLDPEVVGHYVRSLSTKTPSEWTVTVAEGPGSRVAYAARCFPMQDDHLGVMFEDVTERRRMEERLRSYLVELERSNKELDEFAYVASHDLKAPLQDIRNLASWIDEDAGAALPAESGRHLKLLQDRVRRLERLLDDLLDYSRAGRVKAETEEFHVDDLLEDVLSLVAAPSGFSVEFRGPSPELRTPRPPLEQVLRNLVGNAIKHHDRPEGRVEISAAPEGEAGELVRIAVTDDGPGIPGEFHERVFRLFQTLRPRDEMEGSGMGLAIVKKVVEAHGGTIRVESEGRGTCMTFTWPRVFRADISEAP